MKNYAKIANWLIGSVLLLFILSAAVKQGRQHAAPVLQSSAKAGKVTQVKWLLWLGVDCDCVNDKGKSPLHLAILDRHPEVVMAILRYDPDVSLRDEQDKSPLNWAVWSDQTEVARWLLARENGFDANHPLDRAMMGLAAKNGNVELMEALLQAGAVVSVESGRQRKSALHEAVAHDQTAAVAALLRHGAEVNARCQFGQTPLQIARAHENVAIISMLVEHGADDRSSIQTAAVLPSAETAFR